MVPTKVHKCIKIRLYILRIPTFQPAMWPSSVIQNTEFRYSKVLFTVKSTTRHFLSDGKLITENFNTSLICDNTVTTQNLLFLRRDF